MVLAAPTPPPPRRCSPATKSYASTLVGIAQDEGLLDIDDLASRYIEAWAGTPSAEVTIANLLRNDSGRQHDPPSTTASCPVSQDMDSLAVGLGQAALPGTTWAYNNAAIQTLDAVLRRHRCPRPTTPRTSCWVRSACATRS